jgi:spermidine/putrescine transport system ATP-binding protein
MTVAGNVGFGLEMRGVARPAIASGVRAALDMVRLTGKEDRIPSQLSGGEQQRVALARALVNRPAVVLLDEPLGALDQQLRQEMQVELKTIQEQVGLTFICVTHHQEEALTMSDRVAIMNHGRLLQVGTPREVYESPTSEFVAGFIGVSNRLSGRIERVAGTRGTIRVQNLPVIVARLPEGVGAGAAVTVSIRPERLHLSSDHNLDGFENTVPARIQKTIFTGNATQYLLRLTEGLIWRARVPSRGGDQKQFRAGEAVFVRWQADEGVVLSE